VVDSARAARRQVASEARQRDTSSGEGFAATNIVGIVQQQQRLDLRLVIRPRRSRRAPGSARSAGRIAALEAWARRRTRYSPTWWRLPTTASSAGAGQLRDANSRLMSFSGCSTEPYLGDASKLLTGGLDDVVNTRSVFALTGSGPATTPTWDARGDVDDPSPARASEDARADARFWFVQRQVADVVYRTPVGASRVRGRARADQESCREGSPRT